MRVIDSVDETVRARAETIFCDNYRKLCEDNDRVFTILLAFQWLGAIVLALVVSPRTWIGEVYRIHVHVIAAVVLGGLLSSLPI